MRFICLLAAVACAAGEEARCGPEFEVWRRQHRKIYASEEEGWRLNVFCENLRRITEHNAKGNSSYTLGLNHVADLTHAEFRERYLAPPAPRPSRTMWNRPVPQNATMLPAEVDWRESGAVTAVKDQGNCGACWSFAATGAMEGAHKLAGNKLVNLSEQQLIDCESTNLGCHGGLPPNCFSYVQDNGGIEAEEEYPYEASKASPPTCRFSKQKVVATVSGYEEPGYGGNEDELQTASATVGPIAISYDAGGDGNFQFYKSGVFTSTSCGTVTDHAMTLVGYGELGGDAYWLIKNQWSTAWGMDGYLLTHRGSNMCGVAEYSSYPTMKSEVVI